MTEWGKPQEADAEALLKNVVSADPELQAFAQNDPDLSMVLEQPEDIDARLAQEQMEYAEEKLRQKQSIQEYYRTQASLSRAMNRLKVSKRKKW